MSIVCKGVIMDFDRTLVCLDVDWASAYDKLNEICNEFGVRLNNFDVLGSIMQSYGSLKEKSDGGKLAYRFYYKAMKILTQVELAGLDKSKPIPNAKQVLRWLGKKKIPFAIVSNNDSLCIAAAFKKFGFPAPIVFIGRDKVMFPKPDTQGVLIALDIMKLKPEECWLVGDSEIDLKLGRVLGMRVIISDLLQLKQAL